MSKKLIDRFILGFFVVLLFLFHQFGYIGHYGFDDMQYAELAHNLLKGEFDFEDHFSFRITILLCTSISYALFGINDFASSLPSLLITSSILLMIYQIMKTEKSALIFVALSLTALNTWLLNYSDKLMPDIHLAACVMLAFFLFFKYRYSLHKKNEVLYGVLFSFALFLGFCSKGTIVLILPWLVFLFITDYIKHKDHRFWITSLLSGLSFLLLYFVLIYTLTGDAGQRFEAIASNTYLNRCSYDQQSIKILLKRLLLELPRLFIKEGMIVSFLFIIPVFLVQSFTRCKDISVKRMYAINSSVILLVSSNFMTISPTAYIPMCLDVRHFLFFIPIAGIAAAYALEGLFLRKLNSLLFVITCLIPIIVLAVEIEAMYWKLYGLILLSTLIFFFYKSKRSLQLLSAILFAILGYKCYDLIRFANTVNYQKQREIIHQEILAFEEPAYVITNEVQKRIARYYQKFSPHHPVQFLSYASFDSDTLKPYPVYLLENKHTRSLAGYAKNDLPLYVRIRSDEDFMIYANKDLGLYLHKIKQISNLKDEGSSLLKSLNDYEKNYSNWKQDNTHLTKNISLSGKHSILCPMYSSTFNYRLDTMELSTSKNLLIRAKVNCWTGDATPTTLVVSIEAEEEAYLYDAIPINKYLKSYSNWWPVEIKTIIPSEEIRRNSILKVYLYNPDQNTIFLDDFEIELKSIE